MLTLDDLRDIADELRCNAEALHNGHTLRGEWHDNDAKREHDKLIRWADALNHTENDLEMVGLQCLADIRAALGDSGQMMQSELVAHIAGLAKDAARYRWAVASEDNAYALVGSVLLAGTDRSAIDADIDAAMAKEASE